MAEILEPKLSISGDVDDPSRRARLAFFINTLQEHPGIMERAVLDNYDTVSSLVEAHWAEGPQRAQAFLEAEADEANLTWEDRVELHDDVSYIDRALFALGQVLHDESDYDLVTDNETTEASRKKIGEEREKFSTRDGRLIRLGVVATRTSEYQKQHEQQQLSQPPSPLENRPITRATEAA